MLMLKGTAARCEAETKWAAGPPKVFRGNRAARSMTTKAILRLVPCCLDPSHALATIPRTPRLGLKNSEILCWRLLVTSRLRSRYPFQPRNSRILDRLLSKPFSRPLDRPLDRLLSKPFSRPLDRLLSKPFSRTLDMPLRRLHNMTLLIRDSTGPKS